MPIHIDYRRKEAFNFIIDQGGDNSALVYYDQNDLDFNRNKNFKPKRLNIQPIEIIKISEKIWHKINTDIPHTVIDMEKERISITVEDISKYISTIDN